MSLRKQICLVVITFMVAASILSNTIEIPAFQARNITKISPKENSGRNLIIIYVNSTITSAISSELQIYKADIEKEGYNVSIYSWSDSNPNNYIRATNLKTNLTNEYNTRNLLGVVFIGTLPYALYDDMGLIFPTDLWFMDLDGFWDNPDGDEDYDIHINGSGDMYPEIFLGRLNPYVLGKPTQDCTNALIAYFQRNHDYRLKSTNMQRHNNSLMYIDDDWEAWSLEWKGDMLKLYSDITLINNSVTETNGSHYVNEIKKNYDFVHSFIHSDSLKHYFKVGGVFLPQHEVPFTNIQMANNTALFYNLYCCYASNFTITNNLATHYLFSTNKTLGIFGSTRTGGFLLNSYLYTPLNNSKMLGEAFYEWWFNDIYEPLLNHGPKDLNMKGNVLLGDPTLRIRDRIPPPVDNNPDDNNDDESNDDSDIDDPELNLWRYVIIFGIIGVISIIIIVKSKKKKKANKTR